MNKFDSNVVFTKPTLINIVKTLWDKNGWEMVDKDPSGLVLCDRVKRKDSSLWFFPQFNGLTFFGESYKEIYNSNPFDWLFIFIPLTWRIKRALNKKSK